jgi:endonuclease/exonuclease/phosphatase family metal-dependent hydrolase
MRVILLLVLLCGPAWAGELKLTAWNLSWLTLRPAGGADLPADVVPKRPEDIARLRGYALRLRADVIAFSEVDGPEIAAQVFPPERFRIHITGDRVVQRAGFAVRRDLAFTVHPDLTGLDVYPDARFHLRSAADITLDLPSGPLRLLAVHLKSGCRQGALAGSSTPACRTLALQLPVLAGWMRARAAEGVGFAVMGDFNRWMEAGDPFAARLEAAAPLARADIGLHSPCWGGSGFLDHVIIGGPARNWLIPGSLRVLLYREAGAAWKDRLSDHCPVSVLLHVPAD